MNAGRISSLGSMVQNGQINGNGVGGNAFGDMAGFFNRIFKRPVLSL